jgi:DHA2 family multidrug resistance protein
VAATMLARRSQFHQTRLVGNVSASNPAYITALHHITGTLQQAGVAAAGASHMAIALIYNSVQNQASIMSYLDVFQVLAYGAWAMIPLVFLMKSVKPGEKVQAGH